MLTPSRSKDVKTPNSHYEITHDTKRVLIKTAWQQICFPKIYVGCIKMLTLCPCKHFLMFVELRDIKTRARVWAIQSSHFPLYWCYLNLYYVNGLYVNCFTINTNGSFILNLNSFSKKKNRLFIMHIFKKLKLLLHVICDPCIIYIFTDMYSIVLLCIFLIYML